MGNWEVTMMRPPSALGSRRPTSARPVARRLVEEPPPPTLDDPWLFYCGEVLSTTQIYAAGFSRVIVLHCERWGEAGAAPRDIEDAFGCIEQQLDDFNSANRGAVEKAMTPAFCGGDLLVVIQGMQPKPSNEEARMCCEVAAR